MEAERRLWTLWAAAAVVVIVVGGVMLFGVIRPPSLPSVAEMPEPMVTAQIALLDYGEDGPCLLVAGAEGRAREVGCGGSFEGFDLRWVDEERVALHSPRVDPAGDSLTIVDVTTGGVVVAEANDDAQSPAERDVGLRTGDDDGLVWVERTGADGSVARLLELAATDPYALYGPRLSADERWLVVQDNADRILIAPADGSGPPRVWLEDVRGEVAVR